MNIASETFKLPLWLDDLPEFATLIGILWIFYQVRKMMAKNQEDHDKKIKRESEQQEKLEARTRSLEDYRDEHTRKIEPMIQDFIEMQTTLATVVEQTKSNSERIGQLITTSSQTNERINRLIEVLMMRNGKGGNPERLPE